MLDAGFPLLDQHPVPEHLQPGQIHAVRGGNFFAPVLRAGVFGRGGDEPLVRVGIVGQDPEDAVAVIGAVEPAGPAGADEPRFAFRRVRCNEPDLRRFVIAGADEQMAFVPAQSDRDPEARIGFPVDFDIRFDRRAQPVPPHRRRPKLRIEPDVKQRPVVGRPGRCAAGVRYHVRQVFAGRQVAHPDRKPLRAVGVGRIGQQRMVRRRLDGAHAQIVETLGQLRFVQNRPGRAVRSFFAGDTEVDPVLRPRLEAPGVEPGPALHRHAAVVVFQPALEFLEQLLLKPGQRRHDRFPVGIFGLEIVENRRVADIGIAGIAQPGVVVGPAVAMMVRDDRPARGNRRKRRNVVRRVHCADVARHRRLDNRHAMPGLMQTGSLTSDSK